MLKAEVGDLKRHARPPTPETPSATFGGWTGMDRDFLTIKNTKIAKEEIAD